MTKSPMSTTLAVIEKIRESKGKVPKLEIMTAQYLRQLSKAPDASTLKYLGRRYRG